MKCSSTMLIEDKHGVVMRVPCGQCTNCRINRAQEWACRVIQDMYTNGKCGSFVTLTYDDDHCPKNGSLVKEHLTKFFKRLRHRYSFRYLACGEYGDTTNRPHYHVAFIGAVIMPDKGSYRVKNGLKGYINEWPYGVCHFGDLTADSAGYVAGYILKKQTGQGASVYHEVGVIPPFMVMSRRPGLGYDYLIDNLDRLEKLQYVVFKDKKVPLSRYYRNNLIHPKSGIIESINKRKEKEKQVDEYCSKHGIDRSMYVIDKEFQAEKKANSKNKLFNKRFKK